MFENLAHKRVLIGITGGIAAYKILELIRRLKEHHAQVKVILTAAGKEFVTPLSIQALAGEQPYQTLLSAENEAAMSHIALARWAQVLLIAPATANTLAKCAYGLADDLLSTVCLATTAPIIIAPAMNQQMWQNSATQANVATLQQRGIKLLGPAAGSQACGEVGPGRMLEANELLMCLALHFTPAIMQDQHLLITAGPTQEQIDPVRFLSNNSSGKMGYALAAAALQMGAKVTLISGPTHAYLPPHDRLKIVPIISANEMWQAVLHELTAEKITIFIGCAAVADYTPAIFSQHKIKKQAENLTLELTPTQDIIASVAQLPAARRPFMVGFAAETENLLANAKHKLHSKNLDAVIANAVDKGKVFGQDDSQAFMVRKDGEVIELPLMRKELLAVKILEMLQP
jgi:phosphopantothenoylcysteine decarboxylase/phosphopantothenate--cysteine ligase